MKPDRGRRLRQLLALGLLAPLVSAFAGPLEPPRTGQDQTYADGDDGARQQGRAWPQPRFINNGDGTISDRLTGLMWLRDAACADNAGFAAGSRVRDWNRALSFPGRLNEGSLAADRCAGYSGDYDDWRLPSVVELVSLVRNAPGDNNLDWLSVSGAAGFTGLGHIDQAVWSATTDALDNTQVWVVDLGTGGARVAPKVAPEAPRPIFSAVRKATTNKTRASGQHVHFGPGDDGSVEPGRPWPEPRFVTTGQATVVDKLTGLVWPLDSRCATAQPADWTTALAAVEAINANGACGTAPNGPWRLPNINELRSLVDYGQAQPALPAEHPFQDVAADGAFWSSTAGALEPARRARVLALERGAIQPAVAHDQPRLAWPVSGPISFADISVDIVGAGTVTVGGRRELTATVTNSGSRDALLSVDDIALTGNNAFKVADNGCATPLAADGSCTVTLAFAPQRSGRHRGTLTITSNALGQEQLPVEIGARAADPPGGDDGGGCFITAVAYGSYLQPGIGILSS